jgi:hypothetical protein
MLMVYIWAILLHMLLKNEEELNKKIYEETHLTFKSVTDCMWSLVVGGTLLLDGGGYIMTEMLYSDKLTIILSGAFFTSFALLSALLILQMLIGVLCDVVARVNDEQRTSVAIGLIKQELLSKLMEIDDGDGRISKEELDRVINGRECKGVLSKLGINRTFLLQLQHATLESSKDKKISIKTTLQMMLLCRSENVATVEALAGGFCFVADYITRMHKQMLDAMSKASLAPADPRYYS